MKKKNLVFIINNLYKVHFFKMATKKHRKEQKNIRNEESKRRKGGNVIIEDARQVTGSNSGPEESHAYNSGSIGSSNSGLVNYTSTFSALGGPGASGLTSEIFSGGQGAYDCGDDS